MRERTRLSLTALAVLLALAGLADAAAPGGTPDAPLPSSIAMALARSDVNGVLTAQSAAWNRGDLEAFVASYADDATFLTPTGVTHGRAAVLARYRKRYPDQKAMGTLTLTVMEARPLGVDVASGTVNALSVAAQWKLDHPGDPAAKPAEGSTLLVFRRHGGRWEIVQDASM
jgi:uncharacterized protein (TIGR02246 family)